MYVNMATHRRLYTRAIYKNAIWPPCGGNDSCDVCRRRADRGREGPQIFRRPAANTGLGENRRSRKMAVVVMGERYHGRFTPLCAHT